MRFVLPLGIVTVAWVLCGAAEHTARPTHTHHNSLPHLMPAHLEPQDKVRVLAGPLFNVEGRVIALQHKFFDAEVWAELITLHPDHNGHIYWLMVPVCALERVE